MSTNRRRFAAVAAGLLLVSCISDMPSVTAPEVSGHAAHRNSDLAPGDVRTILAPVTVTRDKGAPATTSFTLSGYGPAATLNITNGAANGKNRTTSATVTVDGLEVVHTSDFNKQVASISRPITLGNTSVIVVSQAGAPGSVLSVSVDGTLATSVDVTAAGGSVHLLGDQVTIAVPSGALSSPITLTAAPIPPPTPAVIPGTSIDFGPSGTAFATPITLSIAFDPTVLPPGVRPKFLAMYFWNVDHWEPVAGSTVNVTTSVVTAQTTHFSTYALLPDAIEFCPGDATAESDFQTAINDAPAHGTVWVCNGSFTVSGSVTKALTLQAENPGMATLSQSGATGTAAIVTVSGIPVGAGAVRVTNLAFSYNNLAIRTVDFDSLLMTGSSFTGPVTYGAADRAVGVDIDLTATPPSFVLLDQNTFTHGRQGLADGQPVKIVVTNNTFSNQGSAGQQSFAVITSSATGNSNPVPGGGPALMRSARLEGNTFTNCSQGTGACLALEQAGADTVRYNTFTMASGVTTDGIFVNKIGQTAAVTQPTIVTDNHIIGHTAVGDPTVSANWGYVNAIATGPGVTGVVDEIARNTIDSAFTAFQLRPTSGSFVHDNVATHLYDVWQVQSNTNINLSAHRNDLSDYTVPIASSLPPGTLTVLTVPAGMLSCNYWGAATGPSGLLPGTTLLSYSAFSAVPIANQPSVTCDQSVPTTVRYCPTAGGSVPTVTTSLADAIATIPVGGTVLVCNGTYVLNSLGISKPMTLTAENPLGATLDGDGNTRALNIVNVAGTVTISNLRFTGGTINNINIVNSVTSAIITGNEFHPGQTNPIGVLPRGNRNGIAVNASSGTGSITIANNAFIGGDVGTVVNAAAGTTVSIHDNTFTGMANSPISTNSQPTIAASIVVDHNTFSDCSDNVCVQVGQPMTISNNTMTARMARQIINFIQVATGTSASLAPTVITGNTLTGLDQTGSRNLSNNYPVKSAGIFDFSGVVVASGNTISTVANGLSITSPAGMTATDNVITTTVAPIIGTSSAATGVLTANWNSFSDYITPISQPTFMNLPALNARCNWWGSATGPIGMSGSVPSGTYTPFLAAAPTSHTGCTP